MNRWTPYRWANLDEDYWTDRLIELTRTDASDGGQRVMQEFIDELLKHPGNLANYHENEGTPKRVCVIGGGIAGLVAAFELSSLGHNVTLLEATGRFGGRLWTYVFGGGEYGELGAMRIPTSHACVTHYVDTFGLETRPFLSMNDGAYFLLRGKRVEQRYYDLLLTASMKSARD